MGTTMANRQRRTGLALMCLAAMGVLVLGGPAFGQEPQEVDVPVDQQALFAYPVNDVVPDTLLSSFPPQVVCLVFPEGCPESTEPIRDPITGQLGTVDGNEETSPLQPASPDGLTVTYLGGTPRYASGFRFQLPTIPEGEEYDQFVLRFPQGQPSFSVDSPAFRRAVTAAVQTAGSQDPEVLQQELAKLLEEEPVTEPLLGIEACPLARALPDDAAPPRSAPIRSIQEENDDGELEAAVDCLFGANGQFDEGAGTWSFDLTLAAKAWAAGDLEQHGVLLRPTGAPNLAFGDPDTSTNAQAVLDIAAAPTATVASSEPAPPVSTFDSGSSLPAGSGEDDSGTVSTPVTTPPATGGSGPSTPVAPPEAAPAAPVESPQAAAPSTDDQQLAAPDTEPVGAPAMPWQVWLLVPVFGVGIWLTARSLTEELAVSTAGGGALTRLVEPGAST